MVSTILESLLAHDDIAAGCLGKMRTKVNCFSRSSDIVVLGYAAGLYVIGVSFGSM